MAKKCPACGLAFEKTKKKSHWGKILGGIVLLISLGPSMATAIQPIKHLRAPSLNRIMLFPLNK